MQSLPNRYGLRMIEAQQQLHVHEEQANKPTYRTQEAVNTKRPGKQFLIFMCGLYYPNVAQHKKTIERAKRK